MANVAQVAVPIGQRISLQAPWLRYGVPISAAAGIGVVIAMPSGHPLLAVALTAWLVMWSLPWRAAFVRLFLFLPLAAVPGILLQQQERPTLLKDGLFLLPATSV
jgi:hypothetical protein